MSTANLSSATQAIQALCGQQIAIDKLAGSSIQHDTLKLIYETFVNVSYVLFLIGGAVTLATDTQIRQSFIDYLKRSSSLGFLVVMGVLGVISYTLMRAYGAEKKYSPSTKRTINFAQDIIKETIFILMIVFIWQFVYQNSNVITIVVAFYFYLASLVLFTFIFLIKWIHYLCGYGKDNLTPWSTKPVPEGPFLDPEQKNALLTMANDYLKQQGKKTLTQLPQLHAAAPPIMEAEAQQIPTQRQLVCS